MARRTWKNSSKYFCVVIDERFNLKGITFDKSDSSRKILSTPRLHQLINNNVKKKSKSSRSFSMKINQRDHCRRSFKK